LKPLFCAQRQTDLVIKQGQPQQFIISGSGILDIFTVSGPGRQRQSPEGGLSYMEVYWEIAPLQDFDVSRFPELGPIIYGRVPPGFRQVTPAQGGPPPITEGAPYNAHLAIRNGGGVNMMFAVRNGKIVTEAD
jgi:hypothetical protein